ncbi:MAG: N-acetylmuramoyl-L-alanine amidase [Patescibacteria group bacterium]
MKLIFAIVILLASSALIIFSGASVKVLESQSLNQELNPQKMIAGAFFTKSITAPYLQHKFNVASTTGQKIRVLLVPGHEPHFGGTEYKDLKERDLVVDLTQELAKYLSADDTFEVIVTRGKNSWNPQFEKYFVEGKKAIEDFAVAQRDEMNRLIKEGKISKVPDVVPHNDAPGDVALRLYGINKWANEYGVDVVIHVHLNDYPRKRVTRAGEYTGFSIYVPEKQYSNAETSVEVSTKIFNRLAKLFPVSDMPKEDMGIVEDQELIAIGSFNTVNAASMLIEYGYVYESQFANPKIAQAVLKEMALQTYLGLHDFFNEAGSPTVGVHDTTLLPFEWKTAIKKNQNPSQDVLSLQAALMKRGSYPPAGSSKNDCPLSGTFGPCTRTALAVFQKEFDTQGERGVVGKETRDWLNSLYGEVGR